MPDARRNLVAAGMLVCFGWLLFGCGKGNATTTEPEKNTITDENNVSEAESETQLLATSIYTYEAVPRDIEIDGFIKACLGDSATFGLTETTAEAEEFQAQFGEAEYTGHVAGNSISLRKDLSSLSSVSGGDVLSEDAVKKKCDEIVQKLNWGSATVKECCQENDGDGYYYSLLYEFDVDGIPVIGNLGFAVPGTGGEEFIVGEYLTIEYGTELRSVSASHIRMVGDTSGDVEILSEYEAEEAAGQYFLELEQGGIEVVQVKQDMQLVYIPYPTTDPYEELVPAWMMRSKDDDGVESYTIIDAESGYVYMSGS